MFKITQNPTFSVAVGISVPGLPQPLELQVVFRNKTKTALTAWLDGLRGREHAAYLHEVIDSWSGVCDAAGEPLAYSLNALNELLDNYPTAAAELLAAYTRELTEAKRKN